MSETNTVSPLRQRMIEDMASRKLNPNTQRGHIYSCKRFTAWLKRSPDTATPDEVRRFQLHLIESGTSICNRNRIMTGVRFLFRVTLRRHDLAAEVYCDRETANVVPARGRRHLRSAAPSTIAATGRGPLPAASRAGPPLSRGQALETLRLHDADDHLLTVDVARPQPHHLARPQSATIGRVSASLAPADSSP